MTGDFPYNLKPNATAGARIYQASEKGWRLEIPKGSSRRYRLAQLDDYSGLKRSSFKWGEGIDLSLRARVSDPNVTGTWGFGLWNDPFAMGALADLKGLRLPTLPQAAWFFYASPPGHLSLRDDLPAQGWLASTFLSPVWSSFRLALAIPLLPLLLIPPAARKMRATASRFVQQDANLLDVEPAQWNHYRLVWAPDRAVFSVNGNTVLQTCISPVGPLGIVIWIDNQYAAWTPDGKLRYGMCENKSAAWLEINDLMIYT